MPVQEQGDSRWRAAARSVMLLGGLSAFAQMIGVGWDAPVKGRRLCALRSLLQEVAGLSSGTAGVRPRPLRGSAPKVAVQSAW